MADRAGIERAGLGGVRAVKAPPSPTVIDHALLVQWSAARAERRGKTWLSSRELAVERERWAVTIRCERGYTRQLPDLAVWVEASGPPYAVIGETGRRREDRQKMILEGWRDAVTAGRYAGVRFDCASASAALLIRRLAKKVSLTSLDFSALVQTTAPEIIEPARADAEALARAAAEPYEPTTGTVDGSAAGAQPAVEQVPVAQPFPPSVAAGEVQRVERLRRSPSRLWMTPSGNDVFERSWASRNQSPGADGGAEQWTLLATDDQLRSRPNGGSVVARPVSAALSEISPKEQSRSCCRSGDKPEALGNSAGACWCGVARLDEI